jgi:hypothetical protein
MYGAKKKIRFWKLYARNIINHYGLKLWSRKAHKDANADKTQGRKVWYINIHLIYCIFIHTKLLFCNVTSVSSDCIPFQPEGILRSNYWFRTPERYTIWLFIHLLLHHFKENLYLCLCIHFLLFIILFLDGCLEATTTNKKNHNLRLFLFTSSSVALCRNKDNNWFSHLAWKFIRKTFSFKKYFPFKIRAISFD